MAKIRRTTQTDTRAPDLTQRFQNINIPKDSFGQNVGAAVSNLGDSVQFGAQNVGEAQLRLEKRRAVIEANKAFKNLPITENNALIDAKKDPNVNLPTFQEDYTKTQDDRIAPIIQSLSPRARPLFESQYNTLRAAHAKNAALWARGEEIIQGRNEMNQALDAMVATATTTVDVALLKQTIAQKITEADDIKVLVDSNGRSIDKDTFAQKKLREVDLNIANSMILDKPEELKGMIKSGLLPDLTEKDEKIFRAQAESSSRALVERARNDALQSYLTSNTEFATKYNSGVLNGSQGWIAIDREVQSLQDRVDAGDEDAKLQQVVLEMQRDKLGQPEDIKLRNATQQKLRQKIASIEMKKTLREMGLADGVKPNKDQQGITGVAFTNRYNSMVKEGKNDEKKLKDKNTRLSQVLSFQADAELALSMGLLSPSEYEKWTVALLPVITKKIEDESFKSASGVFVRDRKPDIYSNAFEHVLESLAKTEFNTPINQAAALNFAFQIAQEQDPSKEEDILKRREILQSIGGKAMIQFFREQIPEINNLADNEFPNTVVNSGLSSKEESEYNALLKERNKTHVTNRRTRN